MRSGHISIWFFIGVLLTVYGGMIFAYGLFELGTGQAANVILADLARASLVGRTLMLVLRSFLQYCVFARAATVEQQVRQSKELMKIWQHERKMTFGVIVGNRGFFPDHLAKTGREEIISVLEAAGATRQLCSARNNQNTEQWKHTQRRSIARSSSRSMRKRSTASFSRLPNFGEERGIVDAIRLSGLKVPVLVQATPDRSEAMTIATRRDSFCGKMCACNNMMQYGINYSLTTLHTEALTSAEFKADLEWFSAVCRIVKGLKNLRIGAIGARPTAFNTVRYSERIFETSGHID